MLRTIETEPRFEEMPDITVAFVHTSGDPIGLGPDVMKALYGAAYALKFALKKQGVELKFGMPRARWEWKPGEPAADALEGDWGLEVPDGTTDADLGQTDPRFPIRLAHWEYGTVARILHLGDYDAEEPTIARLARFIGDNGYVIDGMHEEWYLSGPAVKVPKTVILYPVRKRD
jgi:hypothetical protein